MLGSLDLNSHHFNDKLVIRLPKKSSDNINIDENQLLSFYSADDNLEALYLASPSLYYSLKSFLSGKNHDSKKTDKLFLSLYKYYVRMQTRCTPFGQFSGCGVINWGDVSSLDKILWKKRTWLDIEVLNQIAHIIEKSFEGRKLNFYPNTTKYKLKEEIRYIETSILDDNTRKYNLASVKSNDFLDSILDKCSHGLSYADLLDVICEYGISSEKAERYIGELINMQLIISEVRPNVIGEDYTSVLIKSLQENSVNSEKLHELFSLTSRILNSINALDDNHTNDIGSYISIKEELESKLKIKKKHIFKTDLILQKNSGSIEKNIQEKIVNAIEFLNSITENEVEKRLDDFKNKFVERFEEKEIPLAVALDSEFGIRYGLSGGKKNPLLDEISFPTNQSKQDSIQFDKYAKFIVQKIHESIVSGDKYVTLDELKTERKNLLSDTVYALFTLLPNNEVFIKHAGAGTILISRFSHSSEEINDLTQEVATNEKRLNSNSIIADIGHLPGNRAGNIVSRKSSTDFEIPYLTNSLFSPEKRIHVEDIGLKIRDNRIILTNRNDNNEIIPKLNAAHEYRYSELPVYSFLCDLQYQGGNEIVVYNWNIFHEVFKYVPRIYYKGVIMSPASWKIGINELEGYLNKKSQEYNFKSWREQNHISRYITISEGDNEMLIDLENKFSQALFINELKRRKGLIICESLRHSENIEVANKNNFGPNEIISFLQLSTSNSKLTLENKLDTIYPKRDFIPGTEWVYFKIRANFDYIDNLLINTVQNLVSELTNLKLIKKWFFIRYDQGGSHLRIRFELTKRTHLYTVVQTVRNYYESDLNLGMISNISIDTYSRELERYGIHLIEFAEEFFHVDSESITRLLIRINANQEVNLRWKIAIKCIADLLHSFNYNRKSCESILKKLSDSFFREHNGNKELKLQIDRKYRKLKPHLQDAINNNHWPTVDEKIMEILSWRKEKLKAIYDKLILEVNEYPEIQLDDIVVSYIHMTINRLLISKQRRSELMIYYFMAKFYREENARIKYSKTNNA